MTLDPDVPTYRERENNRERSSLVLNYWNNELEKLSRHVLCIRPRRIFGVVSNLAGLESQVALCACYSSV